MGFSDGDTANRSISSILGEARRLMALSVAYTPECLVSFGAVLDIYESGADPATDEFMVAVYVRLKALFGQHGHVYDPFDPKQRKLIEAGVADALASLSRAAEAHLAVLAA